MKHHTYSVSVTWTGNDGDGTARYESYRRDHSVSSPERTPILGSSDPAFRGDGRRWNPEQLLVASLSQCHLLWYLHLCADASVVVVSYEDQAEGVLAEHPKGGHFTRVTLRPRVVIAPGSSLTAAESLHRTASERCFIKNSVNFPVEHAALVTLASAP